LTSHFHFYFLRDKVIMERIKSDDDQISQVGKSVTSEAVKQMKWGFY